MRRFRWGVGGLGAIAATALMALTANAQFARFAPFEGTVRMRTVVYGDADSTVVLPVARFRGPLFAAQMDAQPGEAAPPGRFILRADSGVMWIVIDPDKKIIEIPITAPSPAPDSNRGTTGYSLRATGDTATMLGYACAEWVADEGGGSSSRIWVTDRLPQLYDGIVHWFDGMSLETGDDRSRWQHEVARRGLFPLLVLRSEDSIVVEREEVLAVEPGTVPDSVFAEPAGYEKQTVDPDFEKSFEKMMREMEQMQDRDDMEDMDDANGAGEPARGAPPDSLLPRGGPIRAPR